MTPNGPWWHFAAATVLALLTPGSLCQSGIPGYGWLLPRV